MSIFRFRARMYNRNGSTTYTYSNNVGELSDHIDEGVHAGCLTGGGIDEFVDGVGWVVCQ